jgi:hypothetical protein
MQLRVLFSMVNIGVFLALFVLEFTVRAIAGAVFYILLVWFVGSFFLFRARFMSREVHLRPTRPAAPASPHSAPLSSSSPRSPSAPGAADLGFCPSCGTYLAPGAEVCPQCGKRTRTTS